MSVKLLCYKLDLLFLKHWQYPAGFIHSFHKAFEICHMFAQFSHKNLLTQKSCDKKKYNNIKTAGEIIMTCISHPI